MKPYEYAKPGSDSVQLQIVKAAGRINGARVAISDDSETAYVDVPASGVPAAALALYEAAGLPEPLILPHPALAGCDLAYFGNVNVGRVGASVAVGWRGTEPQEFDPHEALELAAQIAVNAYAVMKDEPDPAKVDELAMLMLEGNGAMGIGGARPLARKILLGGYAKREADQ